VKITCAKASATLSALFFCVALLLWGSLPSYAGMEIQDETTDESIGVSINKSTVTNTPRHRVPNRPHSRSDSSNSNTPSRSQNIRPNISLNDRPVATDSPVRSSICYYGDPLYQSRRQGAYQCREPEPEEPAAEAAPAPGAPVGQAPVVVEPVEIVITSSDLLELIPASPQILMDRGPFGLK